MRSFFDLVGFEYKKIFRRKSAVVALGAATAVACCIPLLIFLISQYSVDGQTHESHYQALAKDRAYARALSGRAMDITLMAETKDAYAKLPNVDRYSETPEYQQYARPYSGVAQLMRAVYGWEDLHTFTSLTDADLSNYYSLRHEAVAAEIRAGAISNAAKDRLIELDSGIHTPFVFSYTDGFFNLILNIYTLGLAGSFALAVCLSHLFAGEYSSHADQLILSSKLGRDQLVFAKLFAAFSLGMLFYLLLGFLSAVLHLSIYGPDGASAPFQLIVPFSVYPITIGKAAALFAISAFCGTLLVVAVTLLLSSKLKSPFGVIIVVSALLFVPTMLSPPDREIVWLYNLFSLLPTSMMSLWAVFAEVPFEFFGIIVLPHVFLPVIAVVASAAVLLLAWRFFRNHQVGGY